MLVAYFARPSRGEALAAYGVAAETFDLAECARRGGVWVGGVAFDRGAKEQWPGFPPSRWIQPKLLCRRRVTTTPLPPGEGKGGVDRRDWSQLVGLALEATPSTRNAPRSGGIPLCARCHDRQQHRGVKR